MIKFSLTLVLSLPSFFALAQKTARFADSIRNSYQIPAISYAVVDMNETLEIAALGKHSTELPDTSSLNDRFHIGSNTKAMTAFMIAKYVERGKLTWTTRFFDLFPEWQKNSDPAYADISVQDLLSHRAGIQSLDDETAPPIPDFKGTAQEKRWQFGRYVLTLPPAAMDSSRPFVYSNPGYTLATMMLEKVARKSWEQLINKIFNKDLNENMQVSWPENQKRKDSWGHLFENGQLKPIPSNEAPNLDYTEPAGHLNIRLKDYVKFIQLNLRGLSGIDNYLKADTYQFLHRGMRNYSMGWFNIYENGTEISSHSGTVLTYYSSVQIDRTRKKAYIIFTNAFSEQTVIGVRILMRKLKETYGG